MSRRRLKGALIGAGYFAGFQAEAWRRIEDAEIVAVADASPEKALELAKRWGVPRAYGSAEELFSEEELDFADIATRPEARLELTRLAARRGLHVICQKPMAPTWEECLAMVEACEAARVRLLIHENWRWQPWYREAKRLIDEGRLGKLFQVTFQWRTGDGTGPEPYALQPYFRGMPRLLVHETLVHHLDTLRYLAGEIRGVYCQVRRVNPAIRGEDQAVIQASLEGGAIGLIDANRIGGPARIPQAAGSFLVDGSRGSLRMDPEGRLWTAEAGGSGSERPHDYAVPAAGYRGDSVRAFEAHAIECLVTGKPCESEGREYLKTVQAVLACYQSAETGREVRLDAAWRP